MGIFLLFTIGVGAVLISNLHIQEVNALKNAEFGFEGLKLITSDVNKSILKVFFSILNKEEAKIKVSNINLSIFYENELLGVLDRKPNIIIPSNSKKIFDFDLIIDNLKFINKLTQSISSENLKELVLNGSMIFKSQTFGQNFNVPILEKIKLSDYVKKS